MVKKYSPTIIFLMETKSKDNYVKNLRVKLQLDNVHIVSRHNRGGGLALFWSRDINLHVLDATLTYIDVVVNQEWMTPGGLWDFTETL